MQYSLLYNLQQARVVLGAVLTLGFRFFLLLLPSGATANPDTSSNSRAIIDCCP